MQSFITTFFLFILYPDNFPCHETIWNKHTVVMLQEPLKCSYQPGSLSADLGESTGSLLDGWASACCALATLVRCAIWIFSLPLNHHVWQMCCRQQVITPGAICSALSSDKLSALLEIILFLRQPVRQGTVRRLLAASQIEEGPLDSVVAQRLGPCWPPLTWELRAS